MVRLAGDRLKGRSAQLASAAVVEQARALPTSPGVYVFHGRHGHPIYVGKAKDVRRRVHQHLFGAKERRHQEMVSGIRDIEHRPTATELHALLLEDELIKRLRPSYNRKQKKQLTPRFIELTPGPFPALRHARAPESCAGRLYGPYPDVHYVEELLGLVTRSFGLRPCADERLSGPCSQLGPACAGPCVGRVSEAEYARGAAQAEGFLRGETTELLARLGEEVRLHSERLQFEQASGARDRLVFAERYLRYWKFFSDFRERRALVEDAEHTYLFHRGSIAGHWPGRAPSGEELERAFAVELSREPDWVLLDRAAIVRAWVASRSGRRCTFLD